MAYKNMKIDEASTYAFEATGYEFFDRDAAHTLTVVVNVIEMTHNYGWKTRLCNITVFDADLGWDTGSDSESLVFSGHEDGCVYDPEEIDLTIRRLAADSLYRRDEEGWQEFFESVEYELGPDAVVHTPIASPKRNPFYAK